MPDKHRSIREGVLRLVEWAGLVSERRAPRSGKARMTAAVRPEIFRRSRPYARGAAAAPLSG